MKEKNLRCVSIAKRCKPLVDFEPDSRMIVSNGVSSWHSHYFHRQFHQLRTNEASQRFSTKVVVFPPVASVGPFEVSPSVCHPLVLLSTPLLARSTLPNISTPLRWFTYVREEILSFFSCVSPDWQALVFRRRGALTPT